MADPNPNLRGTRQAGPNSESKTPSTSTSTSSPTSTNQISGSSAEKFPPSNSSNQPQQPSLATRIQSSATGLARSAFTGTSANDYAQTLSSATQGKAVPASASSSSSSGSRSGSTYANNVAPTSSSANIQHEDQHPAPTFRNTPSRPPPYSIPNLTEEEFQRVYTDIGTYGRAYYTDTETGTDLEHAHAHARTGSGSGGAGSTLSLEQDLHQQSHSNQESQLPDSESTLQSTTGNWKGKHRLQDPVQKEYTTAWERATPHSSSISQIVPLSPSYVPVESDGRDVVDLLNDSGFDASGNGAGIGVDGGDWDEFELETELETPGALSKAEIEMLESFRREVQGEIGLGFGTGAGTGTGNEIRAAPVPQGSVPLSSVSLVPDIDVFLQNDGVSDTAGKGDISLRNRVLSDLPGSNEWVELQERYHDEVWGYLRPALEAARVEIEQKADQAIVGDGPGDGDGPAVRRLKMILKHMGGAR